MKRYLKKITFAFVILALLAITSLPAEASGVFISPYYSTPGYGYCSAPAYVSPYYAPMPRVYYAPAAPVYCAPPVYYAPRAYYSPYVYAPPVTFSFGFGGRGYYHHPFHRHGRW